MHDTTPSTWISADSTAALGQVDFKLPHAVEYDECSQLNCYHLCSVAYFYTNLVLVTALGLHLIHTLFSNMYLHVEKCSKALSWVYMFFQEICLHSQFQYLMDGIIYRNIPFVVKTMQLLWYTPCRLQCIYLSNLMFQTACILTQVENETGHCRFLQLRTSAFLFSWWLRTLVVSPLWLRTFACIYFTMLNIHCSSSQLSQIAMCDCSQPGHADGHSCKNLVTNFISNMYQNAGILKRNWIGRCKTSYATQFLQQKGLYLPTLPSSKHRQ